MRKIIAIGESVLDTIFVDNKPVRSFVGGRIACAAASLGQIGLPTQFVSETTTDAVGDIIINDANLWLDSGHIFGKAGRGFQRLNIACPWSTLQNGLEHLAKAFENR